MLSDKAIKSMFSLLQHEPGRSTNVFPLAEFSVNSLDSSSPPKQSPKVIPYIQGSILLTAYWLPPKTSKTRLHFLQSNYLCNNCHYVLTEEQSITSSLFLHGQEQTQAWHPLSAPSRSVFKCGVFHTSLCPRWLHPGLCHKEHRHLLGTGILISYSQEESCQPHLLPVILVGIK